MKLKKITNLLVLGLLLSPLAVFAQPTSIDEVTNLVQNISDWIIALFWIVAVLFIILAAFNFLTAQGNAEKASKAKSQITYAIIAIVVAILATSFQPFLEDLLGRTGA